MSGKDEFHNRVALAKWRAADTTALFALIPNRPETPDITWRQLEGQNLSISGPNWTDEVRLSDEALSINSDDAVANARLPL